MATFTDASVYVAGHRGLVGSALMRQLQSHRDLVEVVRGVVGFTGHLTFDHTKPDGTMQKLLDVRMLNQMGWQAKTSL